ncbi:MAG: hypothetical protein F4Z01_01160 [Gammaproteobacteria bacterium]|nr:hypothetical protein [Gammaproteobacteria bacterium]
MRKAGKIVATIFALACLVLSTFTVVLAFASKSDQENPENSAGEMKQVTADDNATESDQEDIKTPTDAVKFLSEDVDFGKAMSRGSVRSILSLVIVVSVFVNVPKWPFLPPAIASVAAIGGAIYCTLITWIFVIALIGTVLVMVASLRQS